MSTSAPPLPSGPLRFAASSFGPSKPHTFSLRYPASHPTGLSTTGASLTSAASGDVSLRIAQGANPSEPRGRRWAGRQSRPTGDIECAVVWDEKQHCWMLHRLDNIVQLASDDPEPLPKRVPASIQQSNKLTPLALPKTSRPTPQPTKTEPSTQSANVSKPLQKDIPQISRFSNHPSPSLSPPGSHSDFNPTPAVSTSTFIPPPSTVPPSSETSQPRYNSSDASTSSSNFHRSQDRDRRTISSSSCADDCSTNTRSTQVNLALPSKENHFSTFSSQNPSTNRSINHSRLLTTSPASDGGPLRVATADEVEEFDFVDSPPDPEPLRQHTVAPSPLTPLTLPSPATNQAPSDSHRVHPNRRGIIATVTSPAGRPTLNRSSSIVENGTTNHPTVRQNGNYPLILPTRPPNHSLAASPAYPHNGLPRSATLSTLPTAPSPLQSLAYSSSSSPEDRLQTATTPALVSVSPASVTVTTESTTGQSGSTRRLPVPSSNGVGGRNGVSSPIPTWQYSQHLQHSINGGSPLGINGNRSPAPLTNQNLNATSSVPLTSHNPYQSDSGSSVRESDTDSDDDGEEDESSEGEQNLEPVPPPNQTVQPSNVAVEPLRDSEQDAEAEEDDEDAEFELQTFASELEASALIDNLYGSKVGLGPYGGAPPVSQAKETNKGGKNKRKAPGSNPKGANNASSRKTCASKSKANKAVK